MTPGTKIAFHIATERKFNKPLRKKITKNKPEAVIWFAVDTVRWVEHFKAHKITKKVLLLKYYHHENIIGTMSIKF